MRRVWLGLAALTTALVFVSGLTAYAKKQAPKSVTIEAKQGNVTFSHEGHAKDIKCEKCHHTMGKGEEDLACRACHKAEAQGKVLSAKDAFHKSCKGCHEDRVKADASSKAPTKCKDCHKK